MRILHLSMVAMSISVALSGVNITDNNGSETVNQDLIYNSPTINSPIGTVGGATNADKNYIEGKNSVSIGNGNYLIGDKSIVEGYKNTSTVDSSAIYGDRNISSKFSKEELESKITNISKIKKIGELNNTIESAKQEQPRIPLSFTSGYKPTSFKPVIMRDDGSPNKALETYNRINEELINTDVASWDYYGHMPKYRLTREVIEGEQLGWDSVYNAKLVPLLKTNIDFNQGWQGNPSGLINPSAESTGRFVLYRDVIDYSALKNSIDSDNISNIQESDYKKLKNYYDFVNWDDRESIIEKNSLDKLKGRIEKNIHLYDSVEELKKLKSSGGEQSRINELLTEIKGIISNEDNLFAESFKYHFNKERYLQELEKLKNDEELKHEPFQPRIDDDFIAKQLDNTDLDGKELKTTNLIEEDKQRRKAEQDAKLNELSKQQVELLNSLGIENLEEYKTAIENKSLTEAQIKELNKKILESLKGGEIANTIVGYKNFNSGNKSHIVGAENTVMSEGSSVIGNNNNLLKEATNTFVLGSNVNTNIPNSVALGHDTALSAPIATTSHTIAGTQYNFAGTAPVGTVSIGAEGKERTLTNLAAGRISETSTDGINGSQLNAVVNSINSINDELTALKNAPKGGKTVIKAGDGLNLTEGEDGSITLSNALNFNAGNGIAVNKEGNNITITNTKPFEDTDKEKLNTASTNANSALEKTNANEDAINTANGKITANEGKITTQEGKMNDLTSRVTSNEGAINTANGKISANEGKITTNKGNITSLTNNVTTIGNTANSALNKANTNAETINNVSGVANEALGKANTAVQPDKLKAGDGISVNKTENGEITITNTRESGNGLADLTIEGKDNITVNKDGNKYVIGNKVLPSTGNTLPKLAVAGDKNIDATIDDNNHVSLKLKDNLDVQNLKSKTINSDNLTAENINTGNLNAKNVNAEKLIIGGNELGAKGLTVGNININENGIDAGNKPINNVANGEVSPVSKQAINGSQIFPIVNQINLHEQHLHGIDNRVTNLEKRVATQNKRLEARIAGVAALNGIPQATLPGAGALGAGASSSGSAHAIAVGYSRISDNAKHIIKTSFTIDSQKRALGSVGYAYQFR